MIGLLVGVLPVALGLAWLPSLRRASPEWLAAFMALTAGLLTFLAFEALAEAFDLQATLPSGIGGVGLVLLGVSSTYLFLTLLSRRFAGGEGVVGGVGARDARRGRDRVAQPRRGPRDRDLVRGGRARAGNVLRRRLHGAQRDRGTRDRLAARGAWSKVSFRRLAGLALIAGAPAIPGAWLGGFVTSDVLGVLFFAGAAGAAFEVVVEVGRYVSRKAPGRALVGLRARRLHRRDRDHVRDRSPDLKRQRSLATQL